MNSLPPPHSGHTIRMKRLPWIFPGRGKNNDIWSNWIETKQLDSTRAAITRDRIRSILTACL